MRQQKPSDNRPTVNVAEKVAYEVAATFAPMARAIIQREAARPHGQPSKVAGRSRRRAILARSLYQPCRMMIISSWACLRRWMPRDARRAAR